jgi:hypothetical protein
MTSMFLPKDLTASEEDLVASVTRELLNRRCPSTSEEEQAVRYEAAQVAAEMIWEARRHHQAVTPEILEDPEEEGLEEELAASGYHQRLARLRETNLAIQEAEDREAAEGR